MRDPNSTPEQHAMERRFSLPYNWLKGNHTRHVRQKNGIWAMAHALAGDIRGKDVLDAGCGDGWYSALMLKEGARVSGIDYSERAIAFAQDILPDGKFSVASITELPFKDATFDVVFSFQVIEHLPPEQVRAAVAELARVVRPGGKIIVSVPSIVRPKSAAHFQHFTETMLRDLFAPYVSEGHVKGQDLHTWTSWIIERFIQNRVWTLEQVGSWFNRAIYLRHYNETDPSRGHNLMYVGTRA